MKESEPSSEQTNGQSSESKSDDKVVEKSDGAQNGEKAISKPKNEAKGKSLKAPGSSSGEKVDSVADDADDVNTDEVPNLQLAWEVFEIAKNIYQR